MRIPAKIKSCLILLALFFIGGFVSSLHGAGTSSAQFLKMGAGARAAAMGDAFSAVADDVTATYWNPAGLAQIKTPEMSLMQNSSLIDTQYQYLAGGFPYHGKAIGLSLYRLD